MVNGRLDPRAIDDFQGMAAERPVGWCLLPGLSPYAETVAAMDAEVAAIAAGRAPEAVWLLEHPPLYTAGTSARREDLLEPDRLPVFRTGRGGQYTWHGPGQRVAYVMLDLARRKPDLRLYVAALEACVIRALAEFGVEGERRANRVGVWVARPDKGVGAEDKIAAIGVRVRRWVAFHGLAVNIHPDLADYAGIVPCGIEGFGVTSLTDLGHGTTMVAFDMALRRAFEGVFGPTVDADEAGLEALASG